jgi:hypothetical protein
MADFNLDSKQVESLAGRFIDALESIAFDLSAIRNQLNPNERGTTVSHLIDSIDRIDVSGIESSLDDMVTPALRLIKESIDCIPAPKVQA